MTSIDRPTSRPAGADGRRSPAETRSSILEAARQRLLVDGFGRLSTRGVAQAAGVPLSQLHYHFGSKQQLILDVLEAENARRLARQTAMYSEDRPLWQRYEQACDFLEDDLESGYVRVLQEMIAAGWSDPTIGGRVRQLLLGWLALLTEVVREAEQTLGSLGGTNCCLVIEINNRDWVDGTSNLAGDHNFHPFLWVDGQMTDLGTLRGPNASAGGLNDRGDVTVGGSDTGIPDPLGEDFCGFGTFQVCLSYVWHEGKRALIPTLGGNNNDVNTINNRGQVLAFAETASPDPTCTPPQVLGFEAFIWNRKAAKSIHSLHWRAIPSPSVFG